MFTTPSACIHFRSGKYFNFRSVFAQALHCVCLRFFAIKYFLSNWHKIQLWHKFSLVIFIWLMPFSQLYLGLTSCIILMKDFPGVTIEGFPWGDKFPWQLLLLVAKRKKRFIDRFEIFTSGRYQRHENPKNITL